jgi:hypothetical protein
MPVSIRWIVKPTVSRPSWSSQNTGGPPRYSGTAPWWTLIVPMRGERERLLADDRVVERDRDVGAEAAERCASLVAVQRRHADDLGRDVLERRPLARVRVRAAEREPDRRRGDADTPQLAQRAAQVAPAHRLVEDHRAGASREEARRDPFRVAREHDDVHVRKYSTSRIGQRALRWSRRSA